MGFYNSDYHNEEESFYHSSSVSFSSAGADFMRQQLRLTKCLCQTPGIYAAIVRYVPGTIYDYALF